MDTIMAFTTLYIKLTYMALLFTGFMLWFATAYIFSKIIDKLSKRW